METAPSAKLLITPSQLGKALGLSTGHVYRLVRQRRVPFVKIGAAVRFRPEAIEAWIRGQEVITVAQVLKGKVR